MVPLLPTLRSLARARGYSLTVVGTLGAAIAAVQMLFGVFDAALLHPLPFPDADRLVELRQPSVDGIGEAGLVAHPTFRRWRDELRGVMTLGAYRPAEFTLTGSDLARPTPGALVTAGFDQALGVSPVRGRFFRVEEDVPGGPDLVVISHAIWQDHFGGDPDVLERTVTLNGTGHSVIGVLPPEWDFPAGAAVWVPLRNDDVRRGDRFRFLNVVGRPLDGVSDADVARRLAEMPSADVPVARSFLEALEGEVRVRLTTLMIAVLGTFLVAATTVGTLTLARRLERRGNGIVLLSLGATRRGLALTQIAEIVVLMLAAVALGGVATAVGLDVVNSLIPPDLLRGGSPSFGGRVAALGVGLALVGVVVASLPPLLAIPPSDLSRGSAATRPNPAVRWSVAALLSVEAAVSVTLGTATTLLAMTLLEQSGAELGFEVEGLTEVALSLSTPSYRAIDRRLGLVGDVEEGLRAVPGVVDAGVGLGSPLSPTRMRTSARREDQTSLGEVVLRPSSPGYGEALGVRLLDGRLFRTDDDARSAPVAVVNRAAAGRFWPEGSVVGRRITLETEPGGSQGPRTVVGVIDDVRSERLFGPVAPEVWIPYAQAPVPSLTFLLRTAEGFRPDDETLRRTVAAVDATLAVARIGPVGDHAGRLLQPLRVQTTITLVFGGLAALLALLSLNAITSALAAYQRRALCVRAAVGAGPARLRARLLAWGLLPASLGIVAGVVVTGPLIPFLRAAAPGLPPRSGAAIAMVSGLLFLAMCVSLLRPVVSVGRLRIARVLAGQGPAG